MGSKMIQLDTIMEMINWNNNVKTQEQGMTLARKINDISVFLQPMKYGSKAVWDNCAKILAEKTDDDLKPYLVNLLEWLQDINWPGAFIILDRLKIFSGKKLIDPLEKSVKNAIESDSEEGLIWLDYLSELLDNEELKAELQTKTLAILQKHYHNWAGWYKK